MKVLVTAFDPFGGLDTNSSLMVLEKLNDNIDGIEVEKLIIPTVYYKAADVAWTEAKKRNCDAVLSLGQAGGRRSITVETIAVNYACSHVKDNDGCSIEGEKLFDEGENAYFSTVDTKKLVETVKNTGFSAELSVSAGGFVCNSLLYTLLKRAEDESLKMPIGFVHLPYEKNQGQDGFSMKCEDMCLCVEQMIKNIDI